MAESVFHVGDVNKDINALNDNLQMNQDFYLNECVIGNYNGLTLYRRNYVTTKTDVAKDTPVTFFTGLPIPSKVLKMSTQFYLNDNICEPADRYIRAYIDAAGNMIVNQAVGASLPKMVCFLSLEYIH